MSDLESRQPLTRTYRSRHIFPLISQVVKYVNACSVNHATHLSRSPIQAERKTLVDEQPHDCTRVVLKANDNVVTFADVEQQKLLRNTFASAHINLLIGSGFSLDVVPTLEKREAWFTAIDSTFNNPNGNFGDDNLYARRLLKAEYFHSVMEPLDTAEPTRGQINAISSIMGLVRKRGAVTIPRRVNFFTTNYDPLLERALEVCSVPFNDGFDGREHPKLTTASFSRLQYEQSLFMEYASQVPTANVMKIHGSLTWNRADNGIEYSSPSRVLQSCLLGCESITELPEIRKIREMIKNEPDDNAIRDLLSCCASLTEDQKDALATFEENYDSTLSIVNPTKKKFQETVLEQSYYDMLRIYANELDRNNALLVSFGFSFNDEHIRDLTLRAAKSNPKMLILASCYSMKDYNDFKAIFSGCDNVMFLTADKDNKLSLNNFSEGLRCLSR